MSEFTLPPNSKVGEGKHWALGQSAQRVKSFRIYRWDPANNANPTKDNANIQMMSPAALTMNALRASASDFVVWSRCTMI